MAWQKCPICNGKGYETIAARIENLENINKKDRHYTCKTCKGQKIISEITGLPPSTIQEYPMPYEVKETLRFLKETELWNAQNGTSNQNITYKPNELIC